MEGKKNTIKSFTDLVAWQKGHALVLEIYRDTKKFPKEELFGLSSQMRRSAVSITSNSAVGFGRSSAKDKKQFYTMSLTSIAELQNQMLISRDVGYTTKEKFAVLANQSVEVHKLVNGLIKYIKTSILHT
jgi:four helix bundle protein